jgi:hypothetical protein
VSFLCNNLLLSRIIPTPSPFILTIVHRIILITVLTLTSPALCRAETLLDLNANVNVNVKPGTVVATEVVHTNTSPAIASDTIASPAITCCAAPGRSRHDSSLDRLWVVSTRSLTSDACRAPLDAPKLGIHQLNQCGASGRSDCNSLLQSLSSDRQVLIHVHGNRMNPDDAIERGMFVYKNTVAYADAKPLDFIIFSWPSEQTGILLKDGREKAERTDAEGLYLAWLLREFSARNVRVTLIGFSFGGRVATGAVHALAGG